ncbi:L-2-hydroxyglutarate dehydrogenase, mitochondrial isoform X3 [Capsicum annuum]|uniref:L-2-hydroxyglutarate dehydrogenase, mitochondrial isoform X3 n=1 Tax=Capsicum annuum TaxID=4072 RepID=UPI001FB0AA2D|nr:L-2-hydroxyglutarate dehydrogenase, mitochondrial isoform X3 [Capsicum annuum]
MTGKILNYMPKYFLLHINYMPKYFLLAKFSQIFIIPNPSARSIFSKMMKLKNSITKIVYQKVKNVSKTVFSSSSISKEKVDCLVIGAVFGTGTSSRNSEVIHAGIYYPPGSLKASFCVRGKELLYKYCKDREIPHKQIGKLIVATGLSEVPKLSALMNRGIQNGVEGLRMMEGYEATTLEPELHCVKALWSPSSGIVDSHSLMLSLVGEAESHGTTFSYNTAVIGGRIEGNQIQIHVSGSDALANWNERTELDSELILIPKLVVNSAGLSAPAIAKRIKGLPDSIIPASKYARGCYFTLSNTKSPFKHLIYPIPEVSGLGVHVTLDLNGQIKFGPDVEWIKGIDDIPSFLNMFDYSVCEDRANQFYPAIRKYYPGLKDGSLEPGYAGIRPKLSGPEEGPTDFVVQVFPCDHVIESTLIGLFSKLIRQALSESVFSYISVVVPSAKSDIISYQFYLSCSSVC